MVSGDRRLFTTLNSAARIACAIAALMLMGGLALSTAWGATPAPAIAKGRPALEALKPPFTFKINVKTTEGKAQPGVRIHCRYPRAGRGGKKPLVDMNAVSDAQGVATFKVTVADLELDRYYWFNLADPNFCGDNGVGISPVDNEYEYTFKVTPATKYRVKVTDEADKPIAGAKIWAITDHPKFPAYVEGVFSTSANSKTTTTGLATINMPEAKVNIVTSAPGFATDFARGVSLSKDQPYTVRLGRGVSVKGQLLDQAGKPVAGAEISAKRKDFVLDYFEDFILKGKTDARGEFELRGALAGGYTVMAQAAGVDRALTIEPAEVNVAAGAAPWPVKMQARAGTLIKGKYVSHTKLPLADRRIFVFVSEPTRMNWEAKTAKDGTFDVTLPPGSKGTLSFVGISGYAYRVKVPEKQRFLTNRRRDLLFENPPAGTFEGVEVEFTMEATVSGTIKDSEGKPLSKDQVKIVARPDGNVGQPGKDGKFSFGIPVNTQITFEVYPPKDYNRIIYKSPPFQVAEGEAVTRDIVVPKEALPKADEDYMSLLGTVVTADGKPAAGAQVVLGNSGVLMEERGNAASWRGGTFRPAFVIANAKGEFSFTMLRRGKADVWATHAQQGAGWVPAVATDAVDVKIVLQPKPKKLAYAGRVVGVDGKPVAGARVVLMMERNSDRSLVKETVSESLVKETVSDGQGRFEITAQLPPSIFETTLALLCLPREGAVAWRFVPECSCQGLELKLKPEGQVKGRVLNRDQKPVADAVVTHYSARDPNYGMIFFLNKKAETMPAGVRTDAQGNFTLGGVPAGCIFSLQVRHPDYGRENSWNVSIAAGENRVEDVTLPDGITVAGTVRFAGTGQPAAGITVMENRFNAESPQAKTDAQGRYLIKGIIADNMPIKVVAQDQETTPSWIGQTNTDKKVVAGENVTLDLTLKQSLQARQAAWRKEPGTAATGAARVMIMELLPPWADRAGYKVINQLCDSSGQAKRTDVWTSATLVKIPWPLGWDGVNKVMWSQDEEGRLVRTDLEGKVLGERRLKKDEPKPHKMAVDPKTGRVWMLTSAGTIYGADLKVFSKDGDLVTSYAQPGASIAYSEKDDCFWICGKKVRKVSREGKTLYERPEEAAWLFSRVAVAPWDGAAWVVEARHSQVAGSKDRIVIIEPDGRQRKTIDLPEGARSDLAFDARNRVAWATSSDGVLKLSAEGETLACAPLDSGCVAVEPDTGCVWVGGRWGFYRLDPAGRLLWSREEARIADPYYWTQRNVLVISN